MSHRHFVYSTMSASVKYTSYRKTVNDLPEVVYQVLIAGGANVANKHVVTPRGVVTEVSADDLAHLEQNELFQRHKKNGFILVDSIKVDPEVKAADMQHRDSSAPMTPNDYDGKDGPKPVEANAKRGRPRKSESLSE